MKIEFIYTYNHKPQQIVSYPFVLPILQSKETLIEYALSDLLDVEKKELVKISSCVYFENEGEVELPEWFNACNGKFYFENGVEQVREKEKLKSRCNSCGSKNVEVIHRCKCGVEW